VTVFKFWSKLWWRYFLHIFMSSVVRATSPSQHIRLSGLLCCRSISLEHTSWGPRESGSSAKHCIIHKLVYLVHYRLCDSALWFLNAHACIIMFLYFFFIYFEKLFCELTVSLMTAQSYMLCFVKHRLSHMWCSWSQATKLPWIWNACAVRKITKTVFSVYNMGKADD